MKRFFFLLVVIPRLGITNVLAVVIYRLALRLRVHPIQWLGAAPLGNRFFLLPKVVDSGDLPVVESWYTESRYFGWLHEPIDDAPLDWMRNPLTNTRSSYCDHPWWEIPDFDARLGDIKGVWEASRLEWVLPLAQRARQGDAQSLSRLNVWLADWIKNNPTYLGPNWKCGQEASIRVLHLAAAALILGQVRDPVPDLLALVGAHLKRIAPTIRYAIAQDNNHGTSEAAALFIGGSWLAIHGHRDGRHWMQLGRRWLEERAAKLIEPDGSFSQYSVNYHRLVLDTYCFAEVWRARLGQPEFSPLLCSRLSAATEWLRALVAEATGDAPNLGANDGANIIRLSNSDYRDYRPSVQLASVVFSNMRAYAGDGTWNDALRWLSIPLPEKVAPSLKSVVFRQGGYAVLRRGAAFALLRYPRFRFRPGHADALHVDLWIKDFNLLRDAGTYSYNADALSLQYFAGSGAHNTVQFDKRDQMPRLSRFLFGDWLKTLGDTPFCDGPDVVSFSAGYRDSKSATHHRYLELSESQLRVRDIIDGAFSQATLRWRLAPGAWDLENTAGRITLKSRDFPSISLTVTIEDSSAGVALSSGQESRYYFQKKAIPVLEIGLVKPCRVLTEVRWLV